MWSSPKRFSHEFRTADAAKLFAKNKRDDGAFQIIVKGSTVFWTEYTTD
jgi:hypothetical protein